MENKTENRIENGTIHASERLKERLSIRSTERKEHQIRLAWERGLGRADHEGLPKRLIELICRTEDKREHTLVKLYSGAVYIFGRNGVLITVYPMNMECARILEAASRKRNRRKSLAGCQNVA